MGRRILFRRYRKLKRWVVCAAVVACCSAGAVGEGKTRLRLWNYWPPDVRTPFVACRRAVFLGFVEERPDLEILTARSLSFMEGQSETGRFMAMASGTAPDVILLSTRQLPGYIEQGMLLPLNEFAKEYQPWQEMSEDFVKGATVDGHLYGVPAIMVLPEVRTSYGYVSQSAPEHGLVGLVYRKDMFEEVGLDPQRPPQTWDELYEYAKLLTRKNVSVKHGPRRGTKHEIVYGFGLPKGRDSGFRFANFVLQNGGELVRREGEKWKCVFDEPAAVEALEFLQKLRWERFEKDGEVYEGVACVGAADGSSDVSLRFLSGELAMFMEATDRWRHVEIDQPELGFSTANVGVAPLPAGKAGRAHVRVGLCWAITTQSTDPKVHQAAWDYIEYLNSEETTGRFTDAMVELGQGRHLNPDHLMRFGYPEIYETIDEQYRLVGEQIEPSVRLEPMVPGWQHVSEVELATAVEKALTIGPEVDAAAVLHEAASRANALLLGASSKRERVRNNVLACVVLAVSFVLMVVIFRHLSRTILGRAAPAIGKPPRAKSHVVPWLYLLPAVASVGIWGYFPLARGLGMAFYDYKLFAEKKFLWLDNFINVFGQPMFWEVLVNTFQYVFLTLALGFFAPLILALLLTEVPRGKYLFRTLYYLPAVIAPVVTLIMWRGMIFDAHSWGVLNRFIGLFGIAPQRWLDDPRLAMACVIIPGIWGGVGPGSLIYIAALKSIPDEIYEAAELDNAGILRKVWSITLPYLMPLVIINLVGAFVGAFQAAQNIFVMTEGGPLNATRTIGLEIFFNAFLYLKFGYATAMAWVMGSMLMGFTLINLRVLKRVEFTRAR